MTHFYSDNVIFQPSKMGLIFQGMVQNHFTVWTIQYGILNSRGTTVQYLNRGVADRLIVVSYPADQI